MKKMKGLLVSILALSLTMVGCDGNESSQPSSEPSSQPPAESSTPKVEDSTPSEDSSVPVEEDIVITRVEFEGLEDAVVNVGDALNPKTGVAIKAYYNDNGEEKSFLITSFATVTQGDQTLTTACNTQNQGEFTLTYTVDTSKIIGFTFPDSLQLSATRKLIVNEVEVSAEELIKNGDFALGGDHWATYTDGSDVSFDFSNGMMECVQNSISGNSYSPRLNTTYPGTGDEFTLQYGVTYLFSIDLWASAAKTIQVQIGTLFPADPYWGSLFDQDGNQLIKTFNVTTEQTTYTWQFTLSSNTSTNTHMTLEMGTVNGDATVANVYADNISLKAAVDDGVDRLAPSISGNTNMRLGVEAGSTETVDVLEGISVVDNADENPTIIYEIKDSEGNVVESISKGVEGEYTVTYTATDATGNKATATRVIKIVSGQELGTDYANPTEVVWGPNGEGGEAEIVNKAAWDTWHYWYVPTPDWNCGPVVNADVTMENGVLTITNSGLDGNPNTWSSQLFWKSEEVAAGKYNVSVKVNSDKARTITLNGATYELVAGDNTLSVPVVLEGSGNVSLAFLLGDGGQLPEGEDASVLTFSELNVVYAGTDLANPTELVWGANGEGGEAEIANKGAWDTWHYWYVPNPDWGCGPVVNADAVLENGVLTITASGLDANPNFWSSQLFWKSEETGAGVYRVTLDVHSDAARKIQINGVSYDLAEGDNKLALNVELAQAGNVGLAIMLGDGGQLAEGVDTSVVKVSNLDVYALGQDLVSPSKVVAGAAGEGSQANIATNADYNAWYYWYVASNEWYCGEQINGTATFENDTLTITTSGLSANTNNWSSQLFLTTNETHAGTYELSMNVNSDVARKINVNGVIVELQAGDNTVKVDINNPAEGRIALALLLGGADLCESDTSVLVFTNVSLLFKG